MRRVLLLVVVSGLLLTGFAGRTVTGAKPQQSPNCESCMGEGIAVYWQVRDQCMAEGGPASYCNRLGDEAQCQYWDCFCPQCSFVPMLCQKS